MINIHTLDSISLADLDRIAPNYTSLHVYDVTRTETTEQITLTLTLRKRDYPVVKPFPRTPDTAQYYQTLHKHGFCVGAYDSTATIPLIGMVVADSQDWNGTLLVWEFHVAESHRGRGIGRMMMDELVKRAANAQLRIISVETSTANVPAIHFYQRLGFTIDSIDLSFYSNNDLENGDIVVFMKRKLHPSK